MGANNHNAGMVCNGNQDGWSLLKASAPPEAHGDALVRVPLAMVQEAQVKNGTARGVQRRDSKRGNGSAGRFRSGERKPARKAE